jgi:guanylate kinase
VIAKRMQKSWDEISHWDGYDYVLVNDDLDQTFERLKTIVTAERLRREQQPGLAEHVRKLHGEFEEGRVANDLRASTASRPSRHADTGSRPMPT